MKKIILLLCLFILLSCQTNKSVPQYPYTINYSAVDMSAYKGIKSTLHHFRKIKTEEIFNTIDNKSSGIFLIATSMCNCCQAVSRYINEVAMELDVYVYYLDVYDEQEDLSENKELQNKIKEYLNPILGKDENGEKAILTPQLFTVINGKITSSQICFDNVDFAGEESTDKQIQNLKNVYRKMLEPFVNTNQ